MSDFQVKCTIVVCALLLIGLVCNIAALALPEWIINFDVTGEPGVRFVKYGIFTRCVSTDHGPFECGNFWTSDIQPGEGDWVLGCRMMFVTGGLAALAGIVLSVLFVIIKHKVFGIVVLAAALAAAIFCMIGIGLWIENWSKLILRYVDRKASNGKGLWVMVVAVVFYVLASTVEGAALLMKVRKNHDSRGASRPVFERRDPTHHHQSKMSNSKV